MRRSDVERGDSDTFNDTSIFAPDGSYNDTFYGTCCDGVEFTYNYTSHPTGSTTMTSSNDAGENSYIVSIPAPASNSATTPVTLQTFADAPIPPAGAVGTPAPIQTTHTAGKRYVPRRRQHRVPSRTVRGDMLAWYTGNGSDYDTYQTTDWTYVTNTSLTATAARVRSFAGLTGNGASLHRLCRARL